MKFHLVQSVVSAVCSRPPLLLEHGIRVPVFCIHTMVSCNSSSGSVLSTDEKRRCFDLFRLGGFRFTLSFYRSVHLRHPQEDQA